MYANFKRNIIHNARRSILYEIIRNGPVFCEVDKHWSMDDGYACKGRHDLPKRRRVYSLGNYHIHYNIQLHVFSSYVFFNACELIEPDLSHKCSNEVVNCDAGKLAGRSHHCVILCQEDCVIHHGK